MEPSLVIAIVSICLSVSLGCLTFWKEFLVRSKLDVEQSWIEPNANEVHLRIVISNLGRRADCIRTLSMEVAGVPHQRNDIRELLPAALNPDSFATFPWVHERGAELEAWMPIFDGEATLVIEDLKHECHRIPIEPLTIGWTGRKSAKGG